MFELPSQGALGKEMIEKKSNDDFLCEGIKSPPSGGGLALFDIDDTLLTAQNIFIYRKNPDGTETKLTPDEFAKEEDAANKKYDFREFRDPRTIENSITTGKPIIKNLRIMDAYIKAGWDVGILTARALEDVIHSALQKWLMFRNDKGELQPIRDKLQRNLVHAVSDESRRYEGANSFEKKANVILGLSKKYAKIVMVDDDIKNIIAVKAMINQHNLKDKVSVVQAWK